MESPFQITRADENIEEEAIGVFKAQTSKTILRAEFRLPLW
jgi:hypothetical protein